VKRLRLLCSISLYFGTTAIAGIWFLARNAVTLCAMCQDHMHFGFPFPYIDVGWAVPNKGALLWPGAIADAALVLLAGFISAKGISWILQFLTSGLERTVTRRQTAIPRTRP
jgi:hypothetical protein